MPIDSSILKEDVIPGDIAKSGMTTDCYFVERKDGQTDLARGGMVSIFDIYHDKGVEIVRITQAEGSLNPKLHKPDF